MAVLSDSLSLPSLYDLQRTMSVLCTGRRDPTFKATVSGVQFSLLTPVGGCRVKVDRSLGQLQVDVEGDGAEWLEPHLASLFGLHDVPAVFRPSGKVRDLVKRYPGIHLPRLPVVFHRLIQIVLHQLVTWEEAAYGWQEMTRRYGTAAPGDSELLVGPSPSALKALAYYDLVDCGILPRQARLILHLAKDARRIDKVWEQGDDKLIAYLSRINGIGKWTLQTLRGSCLADADAAVTGDYGLPHMVCWFFQQQPRGSDDEMLKLLEPFRGHRYRVQQLLMHADIQAPRRGPKMRVRSWKHE